MHIELVLVCSMHMTCAVHIGLRFIMDVSSSMSRFNGSDRRLDRMCASTVMIMEAFQGRLHRIQYFYVFMRDAVWKFLPSYSVPILLQGLSTSTTTKSLATPENPIKSRS
jgi:hypothetical protein